MNRKNLKNLLLVSLTIGLLYTAWTVHSIQNKQSKISSEVGYLSDQNQLEKMYRLYEPSQNAKVTAKSKTELNPDKLHTRVSLSVSSGMFRLEKIKVIAYDKLKNEIWSSTRWPNLDENMIQGNDTVNFDFTIPRRVPEKDGVSNVKLIKVKAIDEAAYIDEGGEFHYGLKYKEADVGAENPSQLYLVREKCESKEFLDYTNVCVIKLLPLKSYKIKNLDSDESFGIKDEGDVP